MKQLSKHLGMFALMALATILIERPAAATIMLQDPGSIVVQQTNDHPCLFGGNSCKNPTGFDFTLLSNNPSNGTYDAYAPPTSDTPPYYTVQQIMDILALTDPNNYTAFSVGIDLNSSKKVATESLQTFAMLINGTVVQQYNVPSPGTTLMTENNGTGYSDDLLTGFDLSNYAPTAQVTFHLVENNATDGAEEYFLVNAANPMPVSEPPTAALLGVSIFGLGFLRRRSRRTGSTRRSSKIS